MLFACIILLATFLIVGCSEDEDTPADENIKLSECNRSAGELMDITGHIAIDGQNNIWFSRDNKFYTLSPDGVETEIAGTGESSLEDGSFRNASWLAWHQDGYLLFFDRGEISTDSWTRKVTPNGSFTNLRNEIVGDRAVSNTGKSVYIENAGGNSLSDLGRILELNDDNTSTPIHQQDETLYGIAFDTDNRLYFATLSAIYRLNEDGNTTLISGHSEERGDVQATLLESRYNWVRQLAIDPEGVIYVPDSSNDKVYRLAGNEVQVFASKENDKLDKPYRVNINSDGSQIFVTNIDDSIIRFKCE